MLPITALYAALLAIIGIVLQQLVGQHRLRTQVSLYDGGDPQLAAAIRRHGNFAELPNCYRGPYEYSHPDREEDYWPQNEPA